MLSAKRRKHGTHANPYGFVAAAPASRTALSTRSTFGKNKYQRFLATT
jgi:hypothetical protein